MFCFNTNQLIPTQVYMREVSLGSGLKKKKFRDKKGLDLPVKYN